MSCGHHHHVTPPKSGKSFHFALFAGILLNGIFIVIETFFGFWAHSLALLADAIHNFGDVLSLLVAWLGYYLAFQKPKGDYTYGWGRVSIFATLFNGASLVVTSLWIIYEAYERFQHPVMSQTNIVAIVAAVGIAVNGLSAWFLMRGKEDVNLRGAMVHMLADAAVSAGVVLTAFLLAATGWLWLDPLVSALIALIILMTAWPILREGFRLAMDAVPMHIDRAAIRDYLAGDKAVDGVHDLHVWGLSTMKTALSAHIAIKEEARHEETLRRLHKELKERFKITHVTIQVERTHKDCVDEHELKD